MAYRARHAFLFRSGVMRRRFPSRAWDDVPLSALLADPEHASPDQYLALRRASGARFLFDPGERAGMYSFLRDGGAAEAVQREADELLAGRWRWFGGAPVQTGPVPDWHANPFSGQCAPADRHWTELGDFAFGDVKVIWEPSRFSAAFLLVRAWWATGDDRYAEHFWTLVESWRAANPPALGVNWKCGQETSFRLMGWCFGLYGLMESAATTPTRVAALVQMITLSAQRVEANLDYALSQDNNHGVSEGVGLYTVGLLFPELKGAARFKTRGREVLESLGRSLIYDDGAFSQHSLNYHRVMLHDYLWVIRLAMVNREPFSQELHDRVLSSVRFLHALQDQATGGVPHFGAFDGSLVLPLAGTTSDDFRPVIQTGYAMLAGHRVFEPGPWDEEMAWLLGPAAATLPLVRSPRAELTAEQGGYYTLRSADGFAFVRAARFRHRPGHADQLHVDLWWRGINIAMDPGTYSYNAEVTWGKEFDGTAAHNTVSVDGRDQMERLTRFFWYPWSTGSVRRAAAPHAGYLEVTHDGYGRLTPPVRHVRAVLRVQDDAWVVVDRLESAGEHRYRQQWLLPAMDHRFDPLKGVVSLRTDEGEYQVHSGVINATASASLVTADPASARGWRAERYGVRAPALSLVTEAQAASATMWTVFSPNPCEVQPADGAILVCSAGQQRRVVIDPHGGGPLAHLAAPSRPAAAG